MKAFLLSVSLCLAVVVAVSAKDCESECKSCKPLDRKECPAGVEKDACGCCEVCKRFEGQKCDMKDAAFNHGRCGDGLECRTVDKVGDICQCIWNEILCGTDGKRYSNLCTLMAATLRSETSDLKVKSVGPCSPGAEIVTMPEYVRNKTSSNVVLTCEAIGFPTPNIYWEVTKANSKTFELPGDDNHLSTSLRGGPAQYQVTGWLQIEGLQKKHEGDYTCIAYNKERTHKATARVKVIN